jgi:hypothetical protein
MGMFGAIFFIPIYAQGVIGVSVAHSGAVLIPLTGSMILVGRLITWTGRYKGFVLAGTIIMAVGYYLLTRLGYGSTQTDLTVAMVIIGLGLGAVLQTYTHCPELDHAYGPRHRHVDHAALPLDGRHARHSHLRHHNG